MKKVFIIIIFISVTISSFSQERVNRPKLNFEFASDTLSSSIGWAYNEDLGEWIDYDNVICLLKKYKGRYTPLQGKYMMSKYQQNFISLQTKVLHFMGSTYYALIVDKWNGSYEYPSIQRGWEEYIEKLAYIYTEIEFNKIKNLSNEVTELTTDKYVRFSLRFDEYDETKFLDLIQTELTKEKSKYATEYIFPIMKSDNGSIRFYIPNDFNLRDEYNIYNFEYEYFETNIENFSKIIID